MNPSVKAQYDLATEGLPAEVPVDVPGVGAWRVPRIYIACHGLEPANLPALADLHGFPAAV